MKQQTLIIDPEFKAQIPPLTEDERKQLEENILADGEILSPILVWNDTIVDGHNRYEILQSHPEIPYNIRNLYLETREQVLAWICKNQLGRRNLTPEQKKFLMGKQYDAEKRVTPKFCVKSNECRNRAKFICRRQRLDRLPPMSTT